MSDYKQYLMDNGIWVTTGEVSRIAGISRIAAYKRLEKSSDMDWVMSLKGSPAMSNAGRTYKVYTTVWSDDEPIQVAYGMQVNPSYMDGMLRGQQVVDRHGKEMSFSERSALVRYRNKQRDDWRKQNKDTILNAYDSHKEEMDALKRRRDDDKL